MTSAMMPLAQSVGGTAQAGTVFAILASAVIVLGGLAALVRAIWRTAQVLRDNTVAMQNLTGRLNDLSSEVDGRFDKLVQRVSKLESDAGR
ncbi:MAG: hypothetical protein ACLQFR_08850 [Streptosporangiaceae bacterium]